VSSRWILPLLLLIGLAMRLYYLHGIEASPEFRVPLVDNRWYHDRALAWSEGRAGSELDLFRAPFYPFLLGQLYRVFGSGPYVARIFQMLLGLAAILLVHRIGNRAYGPPVGLVAAAFSLLYNPFIYYENETLTTSLLLFLLLLGFFLLLGLQEGKRFWALAAGAVLGLAAATYPTALALYPFVLLWSVWCARSRAMRTLPVLAPLAIGLALPPLAAAAWNTRTHGAFVLATQGGVNLYIGNNPNADGRTAIVPDWRDIAYETKEYEDNVSLAAIRVAERETGRRLSPGEADRFWRERALEWIASRPADALRLFGRKIVYLASDEEIPNNRFLTPHIEEYAPLLRRLSLGAGFFIAFGIAGLLLSGGRAGARSLLALFLLAQAAVLVLFFVCARFRLPMMPFFLVPAAHLVVRLAREGRRFPIRVVLFVAVPLLLVAHSNAFDVNVPGDLASLYFSRGHAFAEVGRLDRAEEMYREALALDPSDPRVLINLGAVLARAGRADEAERVLLTALDRDPRYAPFVWNNLALARLVAGDPEGALRFFERSIEAAPGDADVHANAANALLALGRHEEALARYDEALGRGTARALPTRLGRALALSALGRGKEALAETESVAAAAPGVPEAWAVLAEVAAATGEPERAEEARARFQALTGRRPGPADLPF